MTISFPAAPTDGQVYAPGAPAPSYVYSTTIGAWEVQGGGFPPIGDNLVVANISGGTAAPIGQTLNDIIDTTIGNAHGALVYRDASVWSMLAPGTSGKVLESQGLGVNPHWVTPTDTNTNIWNAGTVTSVGSGIAINTGTISADTQGTISATATGTISPTGLQSCIVNMGTVNTTLTCSPGYQGQHLRLEIKQGATAHTVTLDSTFVFGLDITSFTATATANARDLLQLICIDGTHWAVAAVNHGFSV